jgi:hypothetical protein
MHFTTTKIRATAAAAAFATTAMAVAGPDWDFDLSEDAGNSILTAQTITVQGQVTKIIGRLSGTAFLGAPDFQDVYQIVITDPGNFRIDLSAAGGGALNFDACLFLFDASGAPLLATNDASATDNAPILTNSSNAGPAVTLTTPGIYYLAVSGFASQPTFFGVTCFPQFWQNPGVIAGGVTIGWDGGWDGPGDTGDYVMTVTGVEGVPGPAVLALLAGLPFGLNRRNRRT